MRRSIPLLLALVTLLLAACGGTADEISPEARTGAAGTTAEPAAHASPSPAGATEEAAVPGSSDRTDFAVEPEGQELVLVTGQHVEVLYTLPDEGESVFRSAAVAPGSTSTDMTVVVVTSAEGMYDLRWLDVRGGQVGELYLFPEQYRMVADVTAYQELVPTVVWSPDASSIAWLEPGDDGAVLRTVGWNEGPGTGRTADDNAAFGLDGTPAVLRAVSWDVAHSDGNHTILSAEDDSGTIYRLELERQGDGALAYHGLG